ncbi:MAG TPA: tail protein X [bacterium]|nr:tail protein X [bacterium]
MSVYLSYVTKAGDRWDLLAYRFYGDPFRYEPIVAANPHVPIEPVLESGLALSIPVLERAEITPSIESLPPWKR